MLYNVLDISFVCLYNIKTNIFFPSLRQVVKARVTFIVHNSKPFELEILNKFWYMSDNALSFYPMVCN